MPETTSCMNRRYWARRLVDKARGAAIPSYGSTEWLLLPDGDARKIGAVVVAAESWAQAGDDIELDLRRELVNRWHAEKHAEDADYVARMEAHRAAYPPRRLGSSFVERRAQQLADTAARPGDHAGGPVTVEWSGGDSA